MAKYSVVHINKIASGTNRCFLDMDVQLVDDRLRDMVHLLALDEKPDGAPVLSSDVMLEQRKGGYQFNRYISKEFSTLSGSNWDEHQASCELCALSREEHDGGSGLILDESQHLYVEDEDGQMQYIRLYLSCCSDAERAEMAEFVKKHVKRNSVYEVEFRQDSQRRNYVDQDGEVLPLYEMEDVCVKSKNQVQNQRVLNFDRSTDASLAKTEDLYLPESARVFRFGQVGSNVYLLTDKTADGCDRLSSSLSRDRAKPATRSGYVFQLQHQNLRTYLYPSVERLKSALAEAGEDVSQVSSLRQALNFYQTDLARDVFGQNSTDDYFRPVSHLDGVEYNYVAQAPACYVRSEYGNGNVYADVFHAKNAYDATYQMDVPEPDAIRNCREYQDVYECGGKLYLKYYDRADYDLQGERYSSAAQLSSTESRAAKRSGRGWPYQKIETFNPIGASSGNKHKSFFFSVNIADVDLDAQAVKADGTVDERKQKLMQDIKFDITASIKEIVQNVCPAHTQLFEVYFGQNT